MEIVIRFEEVEPPAGVLLVGAGALTDPLPADSPEVAFAGWLGLVRALADVVVADPPAVTG